MFLLTRLLAALGKTLVLALLGDLFRLSLGVGGWGGGGGGGGWGYVHAQNTGIYSVFASLYNILHQDVEQENLSQASMPFATKTVLSVLDVSAQPQSPTLEPLQAHCTLNTPDPQKTCGILKTLAGVALFNIKHTSQLPPFHPEQ